MLMQIQIPQFRPPVISTQDDSLQRAAEFLAMMLERQRERKQAKRVRQAETKTKEEPGKPVPKEERKQYEEYTGTKWTPEATWGGTEGVARGKLLTALDRIVSDPAAAEMLAMYSRIGEAITTKTLKTRGKERELGAVTELLTVNDYTQHYLSLPPEQQQRFATKLYTETLPEVVDLEAERAGLEKEVVLAAQSILVDGSNADKFIRDATGGRLTLGDSVGMVALGLGTLFNSYWSGQFSTRNDWEETVNDWIGDVTKGQIGITPEQMYRIMQLKNAGYTRAAVAENLPDLLGAWDVYEAAAQVNFNTTMAEGFMANPYVKMMTETLIPLMRLVDPRSKMFRDMGNQFVTLSKVAMLSSNPRFVQAQGVLTDPKATKEQRVAAQEQVQALWDGLNTLMPEFVRKGGWSPAENRVVPKEEPTVPGLTPPGEKKEGPAFQLQPTPQPPPVMKMEEIMALLELIRGMVEEGGQ